jgi:hypothetical protein
METKKGSGRLGIDDSAIDLGRGLRTYTLDEYESE